VASSNIPNRGVFPFRVIWSLYTATFGQAIPSALRHFSAAATLYDEKYFRRRLTILLVPGLMIQPVGTAESRIIPSVDSGAFLLTDQVPNKSTQ
ncbi:MAG: hypothetical protein RBT41_06945, partial [Clostridia bacterium]|nr:hypothetical protein [Clostridia bacterium]